MYVHSFSYLVNKLELGGYTYLQLKKKDSWYIIPAQGYISSVCPTYTVQHFDFTTFPLLFIVMGIINKRKSPTPLALKESNENN